MMEYFDEDIIELPENEDDLVMAVDASGYVFIAHCRGNGNWYCAITGVTILSDIVAWILIEPADHRRTTAEERQRIARDIKQYCVYM